MFLFFEPPVCGHLLGLPQDTGIVSQSGGVGTAGPGVRLPAPIEAPPPTGPCPPTAAARAPSFLSFCC